MARPLIALDADGVLLDFHLGYAGAWARAFGSRPAERDPLAYWPIDRWQVERLDEERRAPFPAHFDEQFWSSVPAIEGALDACHRLHDAGFDLVCVSALDLEHESARLRNLRDHGFPIERVIATGNAPGERSPKADAIAELGAGGLRRRLPALPARGSGPCPHRAGPARAERQPERRRRAVAGEVRPRRPARLCRFLAQAVTAPLPQASFFSTVSSSFGCTGLYSTMWPLSWTRSTWSGAVSPVTSTAGTAKPHAWRICSIARRPSSPSRRRRSETIDVDQPLARLRRSERVGGRRHGDDLVAPFDEQLADAGADRLPRRRAGARCGCRRARRARSRRRR